jgi:pimeloyl-ACP methyl ester carboxylesterase
VELHGGPCSSNAVLAGLSRDWERHVTLVRWDMRGTGKTLRRSGAEGQGELTFERLVRDAVEVGEHVRAHLGVRRVVLLGCSFVSAVATRVARSRPDLVGAYVGADQKIFDRALDASEYDAVLERLEEAGGRRSRPRCGGRAPTDGAGRPPSSGTSTASPRRATRTPSPR